MQLDAASLVTDFAGLASLKARARQDRKDATDEVARQFEALFVQMMMKGMRQASFGGGLLDSQQSLFYRDLYDQQLSTHLAGAGGIGLADTIRRQLGGEAAPVLAGRGAAGYRAAPTAAARGAVPQVVAADPVTEALDQPPLQGEPVAFLRALWPAAELAAAELGLDPEALLAQAALETGWGRHVMQRGDGASSHNLFGIKADGRWDGDRVRKTTLEYKDGVALKTRADFRAYDSYDAAFADYVRFVKDNPRYRDAVAATADPKAYFRELQQAGYATDPAYANKIAAILDSPALRQARDLVKTDQALPL